jgi:drug/metabolite transporter (DMT)-like permease
VSAHAPASSPTSRAAVGYALVAGAACAWGLWPLVLRRAESYGPTTPEIESAVALAVVTVGSAPFVLRDRVRVRGTFRGWAGVVWMGIADALNIVLFFHAYQMTSVAVAVLTHYLTPLFIAILAPIVLREERDRRTMACVLVSFAGLVLLLEPWRSDHRPGDLLGALAGAASAVFYASNVLVNKRVMDEFSGSEMMFFHGLVATPLVFFLVPSTAWSAVDMRSLGVVAGGAIVCSVAAGLAFVWGLRRIRASHASTLTLLEPLVAVLVAAVAFGERLSAIALGGGALILGGAAAVVSSSPTPVPAVQEAVEDRE